MSTPGTVTRRGRRHQAVQEADGAVYACDNPIGYAGAEADTWRKQQRRIAETFEPARLVFSGPGVAK